MVDLSCDPNNVDKLNTRKINKIDKINNKAGS